VPPGTGKRHGLTDFGHAAVEARYKVRYFVASELVDTLYRGVAATRQTKVIESLLQADVVICDEVGLARSMTLAPNCCSRSSSPPMKGALRLKYARGLRPGHRR
jgi:IstB-like ATP binding protein